jgi:hypothetical protein
VMKTSPRSPKMVKKWPSYDKISVKCQLSLIILPTSLDMLQHLVKIALMCCNPCTNPCINTGPLHQSLILNHYTNPCTNPYTNPYTNPCANPQPLQQHLVHQLFTVVAGHRL